MDKYRAMLQGKNFLIETEGGEEMMGFFTTRWVKANSPEDVEIKAVELIRQDESLRATTRNIGSHKIEPKIYLEELSTVGWWAYFLASSRWRLYFLLDGKRK